MSRNKPKANGVRLPHQLQQELGIDVPRNRFGAKQRGSRVGASRRAQRKAVRVEKKAARREPGQHRRPANESPSDSDHASVGDKQDLDHKHGLSDKPLLWLKPERTRVSVQTQPTPKPKSILKRPNEREASPTSSSDASLLIRDTSPGLVLDASSTAFRQRAAREDAQITALEQKLGSKDIDTGDGLDDLLEGLGSSTVDRKRKREAKEWLQRKRSALQPAKLGNSGESTSTDNDLPDVPDEVLEHISEPDTDSSLYGDSQARDVDDDSGRSSGADTTTQSFSGFDNPDSPATTPPKRVRENPYKAPAAPTATTTKYVPPSLRKRSDADTESLQRLRRQLNGHLNKLSEANLVSILAELEKLYQTYPRQDVTDNLVDQILNAFCDRSALQATFVILHAAFLSAAYRVIGVDLGALLTSQLVERLDAFLGTDACTKEANNLISLLCHLFIFNVVGAGIVFEYAQICLKDLHERNAELLLRIFKDAGPQLRQEDASTVKGMVQTMQNATTMMDATRTKFMLQAISDLQKSKMRGGGLAPEHITQMRKVLGSLSSTRSLRAVEPLRITGEDIRTSDKKGKWWLIGASWKGHSGAVQDESEHRNETLSETQLTGTGLHNDYEALIPPEPDFLSLAKHYKMNTDVRRSIFIAIMSATDYQDTHVRLTKLRLKRSQEQEIPRVLLRCCAAEPAYNPYYTLVARKVCTEKKFKKSFQFALWDLFKRMGEKGNDESTDDENDDETDAGITSGVQLEEVVNVARMCAFLISEGSLPITVMKVLDLAHLKDKARLWVEVLLTTVLGQLQQPPLKGFGTKEVERIFHAVAKALQMIPRLQYFIKRYVRASDLVTDHKSRKILAGNSKVALEALRNVSIATSDAGDG